LFTVVYSCALTVSAVAPLAPLVVTVQDTVLAELAVCRARLMPVGTAVSVALRLVMVYMFVGLLGSYRADCRVAVNAVWYAGMLLKAAALVPVTTKDMSREKVPAERTGAMVGDMVLPLGMQAVAPMAEVCPVGHCRQMGYLSPMKP